LPRALGISLALTPPARQKQLVEVTKGESTEFTIKNMVSSDDLELAIEELEPVVAPIFWPGGNHNETLLNDRA
jgi:hypothetical protein